MFLTKSTLSLGAFLMLLFCFSQNSNCQSGIKGIVTDQEKIPLEMVSVALLSPKDSTFLSYTTSDEKGLFFINEIPKDTVIIQLNLLGFHPYSKKIVYQKQLIDLKTITNDIFFKKGIKLQCQFL